jgi:catalase
MDEPKNLDKSFEVTGKCERYNTKDDDNFTQAGDFWRKVLKPEERERLANNIADHLKGAADFIRNRAIENFSKVDPDFGKCIRDRIQINMVI